MNCILLVLAIVISIFPIKSASASNISLNVLVVAKDDLVTVTVENTGTDSAQDVRIKVELVGLTYEQHLSENLYSNTKAVTNMKVSLPSKVGTYPLYTRVYYTNDGKRLSMLNVGYFNYQSEEKLIAKCQLEEIILKESGTLKVNYDKAYRMRLFLPDEILVEKIEDSLTGKIFHLRNQLLTFNSVYQIYAVLENQDTLPTRTVAIYEARLRTEEVHLRGLAKKQSAFGPWWYATTGIFGFIIALWCYRKKGLNLESHIPDRLSIAVIRWSFSLFVVSLIFLCFHNLRIIPDAALNWVRAHPLPDGPIGIGRWFSHACIVLLEWLYFEGKDYDGFAKYIADPLYAYMTFGNFFILFWIIHPDPKTDKYWYLMLSTFSVFMYKKHQGVYWTQYSKIALLSLMVKIFYIPLLTSWTINNIFHQANLTHSFHWDFDTVNAYLLALLILTDVAIFGVGYLVELPQLKNQIKSVEPTLLGWMVCILCYPPFNQFSFELFNRPFPWKFDWRPESEWVKIAALSSITLLWTIYVWATIALGFRASNLTSRGIVMHGPYAFIRHPAYVSKLSLWVIEGLILGIKNFGLVLVFVVVYHLRAITEERHLQASDSDYAKYKEKVPWRFIPGLI